MSIDEFCERVEATESEETELRWYLAYLRWRATVESLFAA